MIQPIIIRDEVKVCPTCHQEIEEDIDFSGWDLLLALVIIVVFVALIMLSLPWIFIGYHNYVQWVNSF